MIADTNRLALVLFIASIAMVAFAYGIAVGKYELFPYAVIRDALSTGREISATPHHLFPIRYPAAGAETYDEDAMAPGVTLITSYWSDASWLPGVRLIDAAGTRLHRWDVDPGRIWPTSPHEDHIAGRKNTAENYIHGTYLFPDGDILLNIEYLGLVRLDACGNVVWKLPYRTHHSVHRSESGDFWVAGGKWVETPSERKERFPGLAIPFFEETALKVSPDGDIIQEISLLKALFDAGHQDLFWKYRKLTGDVSHLNDVEPLSARMAADFPGAREGDLVVSFRNLNAIALLDTDGRMRWLEAGRLHFQHDPDFEPGGWITVFDNRPDGTHTGKYLGGSAIVALSPSTGRVRQIYPASASQFFYTFAGGKHQLLENGNRLITEARAGRVFEVDASGETVWEWVQEPYDSEHVPEVLEGTRYDLSVSAVAAWPCH